MGDSPPAGIAKRRPIFHRPLRNLRASAISRNHQAHDVSTSHRHFSAGTNSDRRFKLAPSPRRAPAGSAPGRPGLSNACDPFSVLPLLGHWRSTSSRACFSALNALVAHLLFTFATAADCPATLFRPARLSFGSSALAARFHCARAAEVRTNFFKWRSRQPAGESARDSGGGRVRRAAIPAKSFCKLVFDSRVSTKTAVKRLELLFLLDALGPRCAQVFSIARLRFLLREAGSSGDKSVSFLKLRRLFARLPCRRDVLFVALDQLTQLLRACWLNSIRSQTGHSLCSR